MDQRPEKVRVAFHPLAGVEHEPMAFAEVPGIPERDEGVVLEARIEQARVDQIE
jgi:hypothetical protein